MLTLHDSTRKLVESLWADEWPRNPAILDFGRRSQAYYEALGSIQISSV
jgi:hypothetical protein